MTNNQEKHNHTNLLKIKIMSKKKNSLLNPQKKKKERKKRQPASSNGKQKKKNENKKFSLVIIRIEKKKKKKKNNVEVYMGIVVIQPPNFLSILGRKLFGGPVEKTPSFSLSPFQPNMKHPPKSFPSSFSLPFFFHHS